MYIRAARFLYRIIRLSISSAFYPSKQTQSGDAVSRAECCLPSWLCHMLLVKEPAPGEQYVRMAAGNTRTAVQQNKTEEEYESRGRAAKSPQKTKQTTRETTNLLADYKQQRGDGNEKHRN